MEHPEAHERFHQRPEWRSNTMDTTTRFGSVDKWLQNCVSGSNGSHKACSQPSIVEGYPSRLLELDKVEISGNVQLVDTRVWSDLKPEYTTLSHCWGSPDGPRPLETRAENLRDHETGIPMESLPKTFRDAIEINLRLHRNYLWIDSLCIVQDDNSDWEREADLMAAIYGNSFFTIAATSSVDCEGGCDLEPWSLKIVEATSTCTSSHHIWYQAGARFHFKLKRSEPLHRLWVDTTRSTKRPPLHTRGWVLQEMILSPRILHMMTRQMIWQCRKVFDHEENSEGVLDDDVPSSLTSSGFLWNQYQEASYLDDHEASKIWWEIVENYSQMMFTYPADKLPALAGIVQFQAASRNDKPLLGLWEKSIAWDLSWTLAEPQKSRSPNAPT